MLVHHDPELTLELLLFLVVRPTPSTQRGHILNDHKANFIASLVEQVWFDFDLFNRQLAIQTSQKGIPTCFRTMLKPSFFSNFKS